MKTRAMVGFTRSDALAWIDHEARCAGAWFAVMDNTVTLSTDDRYVILGPGDSVSSMDLILFDEIIEREAA
jgi:hypothetical protein